jgi:hypothetical protein
LRTGDFSLAVSPVQRKNQAVLALLDKFNVFLESTSGNGGSSALESLFLLTFDGLFGQQVHIIVPYTCAHIHIKNTRVPT